MRRVTTLSTKASVYLRPLPILLLSGSILLATQNATAEDLSQEDHPLLYLDVRMEIPHPPQRYGLGELRHLMMALDQAGYSCRAKAHTLSAQITCGEGGKQTLIDLAVDQRRNPNELLIVKVRTDGPKGPEIPVDEYPEFLSKFLNPKG